MESALAVRNSVSVRDLTGEVVMAKSLDLPARLSLVVLAAVTIPSGLADTTIDRMLLPIEVLGSESQTVSRTWPFLLNRLSQCDFSGCRFTACGMQIKPASSSTPAPGYP